MIEPLGARQAMIEPKCLRNPRRSRRLWLCQWVASAAFAAVAVFLFPLAVEGAVPGKNGRIAYDTNQGSISTLKPSGEGDKQVIGEGVHPAFAPNGRKLAFSQGGNIWAARASGKRQRNLTNDDAGGGGTSLHFDPAFSPDGDRIVFEADRISQPLEGNPGFPPLFGVWIMDADGSHQRDLTEPTSFSSSSQSSGNPAFSPDGTTIAFQREDEIWTMRADGTHQRRLAGPGASPNFSPDGQRIVFADQTGGDVYVMREDGTHKRRVSSGDEPAFSPNGNRIVYSHNRDLFKIKPSGNRKRHVTKTAGGEGDPDWGVQN